MSTFKNKNSLRTIEAQTVQKLKNNELGQNLLVLIKRKRVAIALRRGRTLHSLFLFRLLDSLMVGNVWTKFEKQSN